ncbi:hypothetical protein ACVWYN_003552, partial [Pedobacter sp. UYP24]
MIPGVESRNVSVITKVMTAIALPNSDAFDEKLRQAINTPDRISIKPITMERPAILAMLKPQDNKGLCSINGLIVYNGDTGPAKTDDSGPVITVINGPLFMYNY